MCNACSLLITKSKKVYWKTGVDSHDSLHSLFVKKDKELVDDKRPPDNTFARIEISPENNDYLRPNKWIYTIDERVKPDWLDKSYEKPCWNRFKKWKKEVYSSFNLKDVLNPLNPFKIKPPKKITKRYIEAVRLWASVRDSAGDSVGASVRDSVGASVRASVGASIWHSVGDSVGASVGASVWHSVGDSVGDSVWHSVGDSVWHSIWDSVGTSVRASIWDSVRDSVGASVRAYIDTFFPKIKKWKYIDYRKKPFNKMRGKYPFYPAIYLWKRGLVPIYDGNKWYLYGSPKGNGKCEVLWEGEI